MYRRATASLYSRDNRRKSQRASKRHAARHIRLSLEELESRTLLTSPSSTVPFVFNVPANVGSTLYLAMYGNLSNASPPANPQAITWDTSGNYSNVPASGTLATVSFPSLSSGGTFTVQVPNIPASTSNTKTLANARIVIGVDAPPVLTISSGLVNAPNPGNATDPNNTINYDFVEFTLDGGGMHLNTTMIDQFGFPLTVTTQNNTPPVTALGVGVQESRGSVFADFPSYISGLSFASNAQGYLACFTDGNVGGVQRRILAPQDLLQLESAQPTQQNATLASGGSLSGIFYYAITATNTNGIDGAGETMASNVVNENAGGVPGQNTIQLAINPFINATGYNIYRSSSSTGPFFYLDSVPPGQPGKPVTYLDNGSKAPSTTRVPPLNNYTYDYLNAYFNQAISDFFTKYTPADSFSLTVDGVVYTGNTMPLGIYTVLQVKGGGNTLNVYQPFFSSNTNIPGAPPPPSWMPLANQSPAQMVFACDGVFNSGGFDPSAPAGPLSDLENPIVSALNRGIATSIAPANWATSSASFYAPGSTANFYAAFFHQDNISLSDSNGNELAYGFPYDDQGNFSSSLTSNPPTQVSVTLGTWALVSPFATGPAGQFPTGISAGDFNGDLKQDVAVANYGPTGGNSVSVLFGTGTGGFVSPTVTLPLPAGTNPFGIATGTFVDGSSNLSIVTGNFAGQSVSILLGNGDGTFQAPFTIPAMDSAGGLHKIVSVAVGDVNSDGHQDIVAGSGDGTYTVFLGNGNGTFKALPSKSALTPIFGVAIATFDNGGTSRPGLVVAAFAANKVGVLPGNGDGTFAAPIFTNVNGATDEFLATAEFNHDGKVDVATSNRDSNSISVLLGNGNGTFSSATTYAVGTKPLGIVISDLNQDSQLDVISANYGSNTLSVLLDLGGGSLSPAQTVLAGPSPFALAVADFDPSTKLLDIAFTNFVGNPHDTVTLANSAPTAVKSFTPTSGTVGTQVVLTGINFFNVLAVSFNGVAATSLVVNSPTKITVVVPTGATSGLIRVFTSLGIGVSAQPFNVTT